MSELDDFLEVDNSNGDLLMQLPENDVFNVTANVSLACFTTAIRDDVSLSSLGQCFSLLFSIFSLERVSITGWSPWEIRFPWEDAGGEPAATAAAATTAASAAVAPGTLAFHDDTHTHTYTHSHGDMTGFDLFFAIAVFGTLFLFLGLCAADSCAAAYNAPPPARDRKGSYEAVAA